MARSRFPSVLLAAGIVLVLVAGAVAWWWSHPPDPVRSLENHWAPLSRVERVPRPDLGERVERWVVHDARGRTCQGIWRAAPGMGGNAPVWTAVLLGGLETGDQAAFLVPDDLQVHVLAMDWPWNGPREMEPLDFIAHIPAMREALLSSPGCLALGVDAAEQQPEVDATRIALIGVSLGVPPAIGAVRLTRAPSVLVLADGAMNLRAILENDLRASKHLRWAASLLASLAMRLIDAIEPAHHMEAVRRYPTLLINSRGDDRLTASGIAALHEALPDADHVWRDGEHVRPEEHEIVQGLVSDIYGWLLTEPQKR